MANVNEMVEVVGSEVDVDLPSCEDLFAQYDAIVAASPFKHKKALVIEEDALPSYEDLFAEFEAIKNR